MYRIINRKFAPNTTPPDLYYGESPRLGFLLPEGSPHREGDLYALAVDDDMCFDFRSGLGEGDLSNQLFAFSDSFVMGEDGTEVSFVLDCHTEKFRERINCRQKSAVWIQLLRIRDGELDHLLIDRCVASGVVYDPNDSATPVVPPPWLVDWSQIHGIPEEFPPAPHTQGMDTVIGLNDKISEMDRRIDDAVIPTWTEIQGKPESYPPSEHTQGMDTITGLKDALDGKQDAITDANKLPASKVSGLSKVATSNSYSDLDGKPAIPEAQVQTDWNLSEGIASIRNKPTEFPPAPHSQGIDTIVGLNDRLTALDAKKPAWTDIKDKPESYPPSEHTQSIASVNGLQDALDGKLTTPQGGAVGDVVGFGPSWVRLYEIEGTELTGTEVTMDEKHCYRWNAVGDCTISRGKWKMTAETWSTAQIDVAVGATVTGVGITMVGTLEAGKRNYCQMRGFDGEVRFYVLESYEVAK